MKLLTDLNAREGVTCIMVTHDTSLKAYATRCVGRAIHVVGWG
jgi:ABC-type lipoprotein export system ATPase subunit